MSKRIKSLTIRFNKEVAPFQHVRIEASANVNKDDSPDEVAEELEHYCAKVFNGLQEKLWPVCPSKSMPIEEPLTESPDASQEPF